MFGWKRLTARGSVRGLALDAQRASGGVHTLLYTDGAANVCQSAGALTHARCGSDPTLPKHTRAAHGDAAPGLSTAAAAAAGAPTEGMCRTGSRA